MLISDAGFCRSDGTRAGAMIIVHSVFVGLVQAACATWSLTEFYQPALVSSFRDGAQAAILAQAHEDQEGPSRQCLKCHLTQRSPSLFLVFFFPIRDVFKRSPLDCIRSLR
eukprot:2657895-Pyramimonas_sp.AAC.1